jgi:hypothetical protein
MEKKIVKSIGYQMTSGMHTILNKDFETIENSKLFGFLRKNCLDINLERLVKECDEKGILNRGGWEMEGYYIKRLREDEISNTLLPKRFLNSINIYGKKGLFYNPEPIGIIYTGNWETLIKGKSEVYFIAKNIEGKNLFSKINEINTEEKELIFRILGIALKNFRNEGIYILDFAPRDIVLNKSDNLKYYKPFLVDTENIDYISQFSLFDGKGYLHCTKEDKEAINYLTEKQILQFRKDYELFLKPRELENSVSIVFGSVQSIDICRKNRKIVRR